MEWRVPGQHFEQHTRERIFVSCAGNRTSFCLFRRHVFRSPHNRPCHGPLHRAFHRARNSKVGQHCSLAPIEHDVGWLHITMDDSLRVGVIQGGSELLGDAEC